MSNRISFNMTKFTELFIDENGNLVESDVDYGYRIFDDYGKTYNNMLTPEEVSKITPKEALKILYKTGTSEDGNDFSVAIFNGFLFNSEWIDREENLEMFESISDSEDEYEDITDKTFEDGYEDITDKTFE